LRQILDCGIRTQEPSEKRKHKALVVLNEGLNRHWIARLAAR